MANWGTRGAPRRAGIGVRMLVACVVASMGAALASCGGGGGGADGTGRGLVLLSFEQSATDTVALNTQLVFRFSEPVDPSTVTSGTLQLREGPSFGATVAGTFDVQGARVVFEPRLPGLCDKSDSGLKPDTVYRVQLVGFPEEFSIRNTRGEALSSTQTYEFRTRIDSDPALFTDQIPATQPTIISSSPANGSEAVKVEDGNRVVLSISENLDPCTIQGNVMFQIYQLGDAGTSVAADGGTGNNSGFATDAGQDTSDQTANPFTWTTPALQATVVQPVTPQTVPATVELVQSFSTTQIVVTPQFGFNADPTKNRSRFPENAFLVVQLNFNVTDFGGSPMAPVTIGFTTENLPTQSSVYLVENEGETPYQDDLTTAEIGEPRAPSRVQGYLLFAGDGDNGTDQNTPSLPEFDAPNCLTPRQVNDAIRDDFDPPNDVVLDTGATINECVNATDGSYAVVWEFRSFRIRNGVTVRFAGVNPAIILVQGDVVIETGGTLRTRADGSTGVPRGDGRLGHNDTTSPPPDLAGGTGVAGGGDGGGADNKPASINPQKGYDGRSGYGTDTNDDHGNVAGGPGAGQGGSAVDVVYTSSPWPSGSSQGGGGGGHAVVGETGPAVMGAGHTLLAPNVGVGGEVAPNRNTADQMLTPSAGGGGGGSSSSNEAGSSFTTGGGSGGAGGGFCDITSSGEVFINGTIDAAGSRGGGGGSESFHGGGGGGGGAGGGVRILTPNNINLANGTITTAGGLGGNGSRGSSSTTGPINNGGAGGSGRIVLEDGDSVVTGQNSASLTPGEGQPGFFRGVFDATRFQGGGLTPEAISGVFAAGPFNPDFTAPVQGDFVAGIPLATTRGVGNTSILIEMQGFPIQPDGTPDLGAGTGWYTVGRFIDSGLETAPTWTVSQPPGTPGDPVTPPLDNVGLGIDNIDGSEFIQFRITIYLPSSAGPFDAGPYIDDWTIRFTHDQ